MREFRCKVECRAVSDESPGTIVGTIIEQGRIASDRPEVFSPGAIRWPAAGMRLVRNHHGPEIMKFQPEVSGTEVRIKAALPDTPLGRSVAAEVRSGKATGLSVEFFESESVEVQGVREIRSALVDVAAVVISPDTPVYDQSRIEIRSKGRRKLWL